MRGMCSISGMMVFFNDTATTEIYTLSLHDALPISNSRFDVSCSARSTTSCGRPLTASTAPVQKTLPTTAASCRTVFSRSEEHTSELQSRQYLVCRLLLEKKKRG